MLAYHNDQKVKDFYLARVRAHAAADELIHGVYWENGKGCAVGCTIHSDQHASYEKELGIPQILARLEDGIFEALPNGRSKEWPEQFLAAIRIGADLSLVWPRFAVWLLTDKWHGVLQHEKSHRAKIAIQNVAAAYQSIVERQKKEIDWSKLRTAAYGAYAAVYTTADATYAATYAAAAAAYAAAYAAADATYAAAAYAAAATRIMHREAQAEKLLELLRAA